MLRTLFLSAVVGLAAGRVAADDTLQYKVVAQDTLASAMMMGLANQDTVYIFDKVENNAKKTASGKPVWASFVNLTDFTVTGIDATTNPFCAGGNSLGNGSHIVVGGNSAIGYGGSNLQVNGQISSGPFAPYNDQDGRRVVRLMEPTNDSNHLKWYDEFNSTNQMDSPRWYPTVETLADGSAVIIGGATNGGFINRNYPNVDPVYSTTSTNPQPNVWDQGGSNPSYEFWPPTGKPAPAISKFMVKTSGLNMYAHTYLMPSGRLFMQANYSTTLWDWQKDKYYDLPDMPDQIIRVYPASGATAMKPLTPANNYTPSILFCGGFYMTDEQWGSFTAPNINVYEVPGSNDCSSITPETAEGATEPNVQWVREDKLPEPRSMGQFIHLPTGEMIIVNGAARGLAGYGNTTWNTVQDKNNNTWHLEAMTQEPTLRPVIYNPDLPMGQRLRYQDLGSSSIPRLYHSSAVLIPDGSVLVAGSNPHMDVTQFPGDLQLNTKYQIFNTTYELEQFYPDYFFKPRPVPKGLPEFITYGGQPFNFTVDGSYMNPSNNANDMASKTKIMVIRSGFSTHAYNFGQRSLQLENTYDVQDDGSVVFTVNPMPTNMNIFVPGPALLFVTVNGVPSIGKYIHLGGQNLGPVPLSLRAQDAPGPLPSPRNNPKLGNRATVPPSSGSKQSDGGMSGGAIAGVVVGVVLGVLLLAGLLLLALKYAKNKRRTNSYAAVGRPRPAPSPTGVATGAATGAAIPMAPRMRAYNDQYDSSREPIMQNNDSHMSLPDMSTGFMGGGMASTSEFAFPQENDLPTSMPSSGSAKVTPVSHQPVPPQGFTFESTPQNVPDIQHVNAAQHQSYQPQVYDQQQPYLQPSTTQHFQTVDMSAPEAEAQQPPRWYDQRPPLGGPREMRTSNLQQHLQQFTPNTHQS